MVCRFSNLYFIDSVNCISVFHKLYFSMTTPGNLWFEVRFEIGMLGRGSDIGGREYWGTTRRRTRTGTGSRSRQAAKAGGGDSSRLLMKCLVMSGLIFHRSSHFTNISNINWSPILYSHFSRMPQISQLIWQRPQILISEGSFAWPLSKEGWWGNMRGRLLFIYCLCHHIAHHLPRQINFW